MSYQYLSGVMLVACLLLFSIHLTDAQTDDMPYHTWEVYLQRDITPDGTDILQFVDVLTGTSTVARVNGERYTPVGTSVIFYDPASQRVRQALTDGDVRDHPFIQLTAGAQRVDWIVSTDQRRVAWTLTYRTDTSIRTVTEVAATNGADRRRVLENGPRTDGVRALPVAFAVDNSALIMDAHPDLIGDFAPYPQYASLFRLDLATREIDLLPNENRACFCGAGVRAGQLLRLALTSDLSGFDVRVRSLESDRSSLIDALRLPDYTQAGDVLIAPDGTQAVYALSQLAGFGADAPRVNTVLVLVDLVTMRQTQLTQPVPRYVHPVRWTEDNTAVIYTSPQDSGTWKVFTADGRVMRVATASFIGTLRDTS